MLKKQLCIFLTLFALLTSANAQDMKQWADRLTVLETKNDANKKRFDLLELNKDLKVLWGSTNNVVEILQHTDKLKILESEDKKLSAALFGNTTYQGVYQLEWLVKYDGRVWSFSEEFNLSGAVRLTNFDIQLSGSSTHLYGLQVKHAKQTIIDANDLVTKCFFEELQELQSDVKKDSLNGILQQRLNTLWLDKDMFESSFSQLKRMKTLISDNGKIKVCTYNIQKEDFKQEFYGAVILDDSPVKVIPLNDTSNKIRSPERSTLSDKKWYGALYLDLIENVSGNKTYYTLLGYKGHDEFIKTRVVDVLIVQNGRLRFGAPIFKSDRVTTNRVVFQYSAKATMMLRYDARENLIVFDNLAPQEPMFRGVYQYYGPDFSYNAFKFTKGVWELRKEIDLRNPKLQ